MGRGGAYFTASFLIGSITANCINQHFCITPSVIPLICLTLLCIGVYITLHKSKRINNYSKFSLFIAYTVLFLIGFINMQRSNDKESKNHNLAIQQKTEQKETKLSKKIKGLIVQKISETVINQQDCAVMIAFTTGDKSRLSSDTKRAYQTSGAMHVLALSGLHIGIIYNLINIIFYLLNITYLSRQIKLAISIILIFCYAGFTGFGPSVQRAAIMITVWKILKMSKREIGKWDNILISAAIIILISPIQLKNIGFQLSYAAVIGITAIFPTVENSILILKKKWYYKFIKPIWSLCAISVACQISTAPLILYYFKSLPTFFLITNIIAIPLVTLSIYSLLLSILISQIPIIGECTKYITQKSISLLNYLIDLIGTS